ncbi:hypothetical protein P775_11675 [Puniceibacterium antarcticum]|uniref:DoxX family protein n=1 Tax=Puniceibacterium antarcticum TaxID=1206336 RepID=A0A2G8RG01_9RHOB|nr:DoxX family protein [Puniceibacterium antarcticum]PIL20008.1 hypothetical protein P775_11675 [Puniceibacterium antarcticum]
MGYFSDGLIWLLIAFFVLGGFANLVGPQGIRDGYIRWGYPIWLRFVVGILEIASAALMATVPCRLGGLVLGALIMVAAAATVIYHREWSHAAPASIALALIVLTIVSLLAG